MHRPVLVKPPAELPVTLSEAKMQIRVEEEDHDEDPLITALIKAATEHLDGWTGVLGRCLVEQEWRQDFDAFARCLPLPIGPVLSIESVTYRDAAGQISTVAEDDYALQNDSAGRPSVRFVDDFSAPPNLYETAAVSVTFKAGYPVAEVPQPIKQAILLLVGAWYENREETAIGVSVAGLPRNVAVDALIAPYRVLRV